MAGAGRIDGVNGRRPGPAAGAASSMRESTRPSIQQTQVTSISSDTGTASILMGACDQNQQTGGVVNGFACNRSADVWGIALTPRCFLAITWPVRNNDDAALQQTYATTQTSGTPICKVRP